jgi:hypothetical protein
VFVTCIATTGFVAVYDTPKATVRWTASRAGRRSRSGSPANSMRMSFRILSTSSSSVLSRYDM